MLDQHTHVERETPKTREELAYARWLRERNDAKAREEAWASAMAMLGLGCLAGIGLGLFALYGVVQAWLQP